MPIFALTCILFAISVAVAIFQSRRASFLSSVSEEDPATLFLRPPPPSSPSRSLVRYVCAQLSGCIVVPGYKCIKKYPYGLYNSGETVNEYCKLGCASSVCSDLATLQDFDAGEIVNGAVAQCTNACSHFCTKGSAIAVDTA
ncbi:Thionin-2.2 [Raphanus sativus]|nr:Thionin-2.2 [Raphanus sativus]